MDLVEAKKAIEATEARLSEEPFIVAHVFERNGRSLHVALTDRLRQRARKGRVWQSKAFLSAFKNAGYGFDAQRAKSRGGSDGIFVLDREFRPVNAMMKKVFDRYLDHPDSGVAEVAKALDTEIASLQAVRLVSHHMRLLGVLHRTEAEDWLVLVDWDAQK